MIELNGTAYFQYTILEVGPVKSKNWDDETCGPYSDVKEKIERIQNKHENEKKERIEKRNDLLKKNKARNNIGAAYAKVNAECNGLFGELGWNAQLLQNARHVLNENSWAGFNEQDFIDDKPNSYYYKTGRNQRNENFEPTYCSDDTTLESDYSFWNSAVYLQFLELELPSVDRPHFYVELYHDTGKKMERIEFDTHAEAEAERQRIISEIQR